MKKSGVDITNNSRNTYNYQEYDLKSLVYSLRDEVLKDTTGISSCNSESESIVRIRIMDLNHNTTPSNKPIPFENADFKLQSSSNSNKETIFDLKKVKKKRNFGLTEDENQTLKGYKFKYRYLQNTIRKRRVIVCQYGDCRYEFSKTWNFLDHARMHLNIKPFI